MATAAVIVAAGRGTRAGGGLPKQWQSLRGRTLVAWVLEAFRVSPLVDRICLVLHPNDMDLAAGYLGHPDVQVAAGGTTRAASAMRGLEALAAFRPDRVLIHDVARPLVSQELIAAVAQALEQADGAAPALPVTDAIWRGGESDVAEILDRSELWRAQTPQGFHYDKILAAHRAHCGTPSDDVEVAIAAGLDVRIVPGEERNLKITGPDDFARAERMLENMMDVRCGNGFDVHRFGSGDHVMLCGVRIPHSAGLVGHSDADVGLHSITDAIYGALAEGDIGRHFPPTDPQWRGTPSRLFLEHAVGRAHAQGFRISNIDCTLVCEAPKIAPHAAAMSKEIAYLAELGEDRVSVKATTSERLGFTGRGEGIAALATVTLVSR
ncbi:bifunctional 2-C-methyl-D-erythritol 4-phosphate cytidylyltransferase/2-C-methyl-D-erythritol 2,4-cyclodiphosphate synthase [Roseitranquillus sediminis]|uniref:bifunctional 2-C-methyl-D-erythritol 4-phosphate cytidylyltransferase/2-C-methyl-D-erythritol 2,4-cyclodiphosphate synthase n=1 Tax=Roseitranquillus sediminis TaxID=2809051 RepID=UPI001D0C41AC|nr:bifunctional 2-C-methyl-D-erythritol 4-phosphate cytidylyltransferase/2-C-methyl-D-erythritol 2,4-cyclodiphosphate synthase [Roseitranquillus sediminis]MBM9595552.1 bifunctional 2-C-methyl-D-erythritol 4-phosphate cytidylyltransferase/2-C-methyl-D-erythritol 2,4-cyclodiphosphate synthase [Roseitranquillus sediminis]